MSEDTSRIDTRALTFEIGRRLRSLLRLFPSSVSLSPILERRPNAVKCSPLLLRRLVLGLTSIEVRPDVSAGPKFLLSWSRPGLINPPSFLLGQGA